MKELNTKSKNQLKEERFGIVSKTQIALLVVFIFTIFIFLPWLLTRPYLFRDFNFKDTGGIGDTFNGITAPFLSLIGSYLVYLALKAQIDANRDIQRQIQNQKVEEDIKKEIELISNLFGYFTKEINEFTMSEERTIDTSTQFSPTSRVEVFKYYGAEGINKYLAQTLHPSYGAHDDYQLGEHKSNEFTSIIKLGENLASKIANAKMPNSDKVYFLELVLHQLRFKIIPIFRVDTFFCEKCKSEHNHLPYAFTKIVKALEKNLEEIWLRSLEK